MIEYELFHTVESLVRIELSVMCYTVCITCCEATCMTSKLILVFSENFAITFVFELFNLKSWVKRSRTNTWTNSLLFKNILRLKFPKYLKIFHSGLLNSAHTCRLFSFLEEGWTPISFYTQSFNKFSGLAFSFYGTKCISKTLQQTQVSQNFWLWLFIWMLLTLAVFQLF